MVSKGKKRRKKLVGLKADLEKAREFRLDRPLRVILSLLEREAKEGRVTGVEYLHHLESAGKVRLEALRSNEAKVMKTWSVEAGVQAVIDKIDANPVGPHTIEKMTKLSGYSRSHFVRSFQVQTGKTPHQYLLQKRLEHARGMVLSGSMSIADIALRCGFASDSHLSRAFKRHFGTNPSSYRLKSEADS